MLPGVKRPLSLLVLVLVLVVACLRPAQGAEPLPLPDELPRSAPLEPAAALASFRIVPGFRVELVAAEPLVVDPVAMAFDEDGRLFVVEMRGYSEHREDHLGRIRLLEDLDGDGRMDRSTIFVEDLAWPTAVTCWQGGVFVVATPDLLYFKDADGDRRADERRVVATGFGHGVARLNVQALPNSLTWGLDQRIHGATSNNGADLQNVRQDTSGPPLRLRGRDFSFDPRRLDWRAETGGGQHGLSFDDAGRKFVCSNSRHIQQVVYDVTLADRPGAFALPAPLQDIAVDGPAAEVFRISPDEPWRIVRTRWRIGGLVGGPVEGGGRVSGYFTAATGIMVYRGDAWPQEDGRDVFICDTGSNLLHRKKLTPDGVTFRAARSLSEDKVEFLASTDNWFRPVQLANGPDGCLYLADMYREVIEHPWSLPESIKQHLDLDSGRDRGRIYRIAPETFKPAPPSRLSQAATAGLVAALQHRNGWHRDTAARLLHERQDPDAVPQLRGLLSADGPACGRLHALHVLDGMQALDIDLLVAVLKDPDADVRRHALRLALSRPPGDLARLQAHWASLARDPSQEVRLQLAFLMANGSSTAHPGILEALARQDAGNPWIRGALLGALHDEGLPLFRTLAAEPTFVDRPEGREFLYLLARWMGERAQPEESIAFLHLIAREQDLSQASSSLAGFRDGWERSGRTWKDLPDNHGLEPLLTRAVRVCASANVPETELLASIALAGQADLERAGPALLGVVGGDLSEAIRLAALAALGQYDDHRVARDLVSAWDRYPDAIRREVVKRMLGRVAWTRILLEAIQHSTIPSAAVGPAQVATLRRHRDEGIRQQVGELWPASPEGVDPVEAFRPALELAGDADRGKAVYRERCATCHKAGEEGHALGPALETVRSKSREELMVNILQPSREVASQYVQYDIETHDGEQVSGIIARENAQEVFVRQANGLEVVLKRSLIGSMQSQGRSAMPDGLAEGMTPAAMADLLAFLTAAK